MTQKTTRYRFDPAQAIEDFQNGPDIPRPNVLEQQIPIVGSAWQAVGDFQDGNYGSAAWNGASAVAEALPLGAVIKGAKAAKLGAEILFDAAPVARKVTRTMRAKGLAGKGEEIHHAVQLNGTPRNVPDWRNNPAFLKVLPKETHRRIHGSWQGKPQFDPVRRVWYGTTGIMKTAPVGLMGYTLSSAENKTRTSPGNASSRPQPPATPGRGQK